MSCGFDKGLIAAHYDGETTAEERAEVERHLASCSECARDLASMKELSAALKPLSRAAAPMSIAEGVVREIAATRATRRPWVRWGLSAAAAVLLAIGTFYVVDGRVLKSGNEPVAAAPAPASKPLFASEKARPRAGEPAKDDANLAREDDRKEAERRDAPRVGGAGGPESPPPPPAGPAAEPAAPEADAAAKKMKGGEGGRLGAANDAKPAVPVVRVTAVDVAGARAEVETFLRERELKMNPGAPLLGRSAFVRDHYLQLELTDAESQLLEKRLAALKETAVARGSFDDEKKRVAEDLAKQKSAGAAGLGAKLLDSDEKDREAAALEEKTEHARGFTAPARADKGAPRKKIIFVFEPAPPAK